MRVTNRIPLGRSLSYRLANPLINNVTCVQTLKARKAILGLGEVEALLTMNSATVLVTSHNTEGAQGHSRVVNS
jgi:hypothetical protein